MLNNVHRTNGIGRRQNSHAVVSAGIVSLVLALAAPVAAPAAPVDDASATCRATIAKAATKLGQTTMKAFDGCIKTGLKDGSGNCSTTALADLKQKVGGAQSALTSAIGDDCDDVAAAVALGELDRCGVPVGTAISTFTDVATCLNALIPANIESTRNAMLDPDFAGASADVAKCVNAIGKNATKLFKTIQKEKTKAIKASDQGGGDSDYTDPPDSDGKILGARLKLIDAIEGACDVLSAGDWAAVGSCGNSKSDVADCVADLVGAMAGGLTASIYDQPGICPSEMRLRFLTGAQGGQVVSASDFDLGWTGVEHQIDPTEGEGNSLGLDVDCGAPIANNSCSLCSLSPNCEEGSCRCENDNSVECDEPFGADVDDCSGNDCIMFFGPPTPVASFSLPMCMMPRFASEPAGIAGFVSGNLQLDASLRLVLYLGNAQDQPCPTCVSGFCDGGDRDGLACDDDATSDFGVVTLDCPPLAGLEVSGAGFTSTAQLSTGGDSLAATLPCDPPNAALDCACSVCELDSTLACSSDADCGVSGPCSTDASHAGEFTRPNDCNDDTCEDSGGGDGRCTGQWEFYCDGIVRGDGEGSIACFSNTDCEPLNPGSGECTQAIERRCFLDPIVAAGEPGLDRVTLGASFCVSPTSAGSINTLLGLPGPGRLVLDTVYTSYCSNGTTVWGTGGANCP